MTSSPGGIRTRLHRDILILAPSYVVPGVATLIAVPVLFGLLGPAGYGTYVLVFAVANGVPLLTGSWLLELTFRYGHRPDAGIGSRHLAFSVVLSLAAGAALGAVLIPAVTPFVIVVTSAATGAVAAYLVVIARLQAAMRFGLLSAVSAGRALVGTAISIALAWATHDPGQSALGLAIGFTGASVIGLMAGGRGPLARPAGQPAQPSAGQPADDPSVAVSVLGYSVASVVGAAAIYVLSVGDRFVLSNTRTLEEVGRYAAIYGIVDLGLRLAPSIVLAAIRPRLFRAWDAGEQVRTSGLVAVYSALMSWLLGFGVLLVIVLGPSFPAVPLDVSIAAPVAVGLQVFVVGYALSLLLSAGLRQGRLAVHIVISAAANVGLNLLLVPTFGAPSAAVVTAITYATYLVLNATALRREGLLPDVHASRLVIWSFAATAIATALAVAGLPLVGVAIGAAMLAAGAVIVRSMVAGSDEFVRLLRGRTDERGDEFARPS